MLFGNPIFTAVPALTFPIYGSTEFTIDEVFQGLLLPLIAKSLPDFGAMFECTATDLKAAAEAAKPA